MRPHTHIYHHTLPLGVLRCVDCGAKKPKESAAQLDDPSSFVGQKAIELFEPSVHSKRPIVAEARA